VEELDYLLEEVKAKGKLAEKTLIFATTPQAAFNLYKNFLKKLGTCRSHQTSEGEEMFSALYTGVTGPITKKENADLFANTEGYLRVIFATSSFGMGVDIPDVRRVIIWGMCCDPDSTNRQSWPRWRTSPGYDILF